MEHGNVFGKKLNKKWISSFTFLYSKLWIGFLHFLVWLLMYWLKNCILSKFLLLHHLSLSFSDFGSFLEFREKLSLFVLTRYASFFSPQMNGRESLSQMNEFQSKKRLINIITLNEEFTLAQPTWLSSRNKPFQGGWAKNELDSAASALDLTLDALRPSPKQSQLTQNIWMWFAGEECVSMASETRFSSTVYEIW